MLARNMPSRVAPKEDQERELLRRAAGGDERAVRALFRTHAPRLHRHASRILGDHDGDAEDVVQQVFLAALDGARNFDGRSSVSTWLFGIATRRALDAARARHRRNRWSRLGEAVGLGFLAGRPDQMHEAQSRADRALGQLDPDQRLVFLLHDVEGRTLSEISVLVEVSVSTLHSRLQAARKRLERGAKEEADG